MGEEVPLLPSESWYPDLESSSMGNTKAALPYSFVAAAVAAQRERAWVVQSYKYRKNSGVSAKSPWVGMEEHQQLSCRN